MIDVTAAPKQPKVMQAPARKTSVCDELLPFIHRLIRAFSHPLPDDTAILQLEPLTIPQVIVTEETLPHGQITSAGPVPITQPRFVDGRLPEG